MTDETEATTGGGVQIDAAVTDDLMLSTAGEATVYVKRPARTPLSVQETHATVRIATDDEMVELELDADELDAVVDGLTAAQAFHLEGGPDA